MVFFTCNACGASLKKNQVDKHYQNECRKCEVLSCMDCGKDFYGDEYASHVKCVSEAEKYQGALYKESGKGGAAKGEKKQQEWLERVRDSVMSADVKPRISRLLEKISEYPNIPRKKAKFENFVKNSCQVRDSHTLTELWEVFNKASKPALPEKTSDLETATTALTANPEGTHTSATAAGESVKENSMENGVDEVPLEQPKRKKSKKKQKEDRELETCNKKEDELGDTTMNGADGPHMEQPKQKIKRKKLRGDVEVETPVEKDGDEVDTLDNGVDEPLLEEPKKRKKKKQKHKDQDETHLEVEGAPLLKWYEDHTPDPSPMTESTNTDSAMSERDGEVSKGTRKHRSKKRKHKDTDCDGTEDIAATPQHKKIKVEESVAKRPKKHKHKVI